MAARVHPRPPAAPKLPDSFVAAGSWEEADALGWADVELHVDSDAAPADATQIDVPGLDVSRCRLVGVSLVGAVLARSRWSDVVLERCDLAGADLSGAALTRVELRGCRLNGTLLGGARCRDVRITDSLVEGTHLRLAKGERVLIERCRGVGIDLSGMEATEVVIADTDLTGADVSQARMPGLRLVGSTIDGLRGAPSLRDAVIDADQVLALGVALLAALGITVDDGDPEASDGEDGLSPSGCRP